MPRTTRRLSFWLAPMATAFLIFGCCDKCTQPGETGHTHESLFVLNENSRTLYIYQVPGLHGPEVVPLQGGSPHHLHFNPVNDDYYIVSRDLNGLGRAYRLSVNTHAVLDSSDFVGLLTGVTSDEAGNALYICDFGTDISQRTLMRKLDPTTLAVEQEIQCGSQPHYIEVSKDGETVAVVNAGSDEVTLYYPNGDPENNVLNVKVDPDPDSARPIGNPKYSPYGLEISPNDSLVYLMCRKSSDPNGADILIFDLTRRQTVDTIHLPWTNRQGHPAAYRFGLGELLDNGHYLAVTSQHGNSVYLIDLLYHTYVEKVFSANWTFGITATSDEEYIYVTASNGATAEKGWVYELRRDGGNLTVTDSAQADMLPNGCHVFHNHDDEE